MNTAYPLKAATFSYVHGHTTAILDIQDMGWLEYTLVLKLGKTTDRSRSDEGMFYAGTASQVGLLRQSATIWGLVLRYWASQSVQR